MFTWNSTYNEEKARGDELARQADSERRRAEEASARAHNTEVEKERYAKMANEERLRAANAEERSEREINRAHEEMRKAEHRRAIEAEKANEARNKALDAERRRAAEAQRANEERERAQEAVRRSEMETRRANTEMKRAAQEEQKVLEAQIERDMAIQTAEEKSKKLQQEEKRAEDRMHQMKSLERKLKDEGEKKVKAEGEAAAMRYEKDEKERAEKILREEFKWGPQKRQEWSVKEEETLREAFKKTSDRKGYTLLLFGPTSHGKSSVANGFYAALENTSKPPKYHHVAQSSVSVSRAFRTKTYGPNRIIDMPGIFEDRAISNENIKKIVTGKVPWFSEINTLLETREEGKLQQSSVECIIMVLRYDCDIPTELRRQIDVIWNLCGEGVLSCHLVLTNLDICDPEFKDSNNLPHIYKSPKVLKAVERMSKETGIPPYNISFVKNYTTEAATDLNSKLQYLWILDIVKEAADQVVEARNEQASLTTQYAMENQNIFEKFVTSNECWFFVIILVIGILIAYFMW